jgi:radial spoke head protein 1
MVDEDVVEYQLILEDGTVLKSSRDFSGKGSATYPLRGEIYEGEFKNGLRDGFGKYSYGNGDKYEGEYRENEKHGIGKMTYNEKGTYHGYFESGARHGEGVFMYPNSDVYSGWWRNGTKHGKGTYVFKESKMKFIGEWSDGNIISGVWEFHN